MIQKQIKKNNELLNVARILRRNMTRFEKHLWYDFLQHYPVKFYKQRIIDRYIADFYCHQAHVAIELDGVGHKTPEGRLHDEERTKVFEQYGIVVLRFSNRSIDENFESVCRRIDNVVKERIN